MESENSNDLKQQFLQGFGNQFLGNDGSSNVSGVVNRVKQAFFSWKTERGKNLRKWGNFFDKSRFSIPKKSSQVLSRLKKNVKYFQTNYILIFLLLTLYCIITNPFFLFVIGICIGLYLYAFYWRSAPFKIGSHIVTDKEKAISVATITLILFYFASVGSTIFWLLGATISVILIHSLFYNPSDEANEEFLDFNSSFGEDTSSV